jgi:hypothetical protein
MKKFLIASLLFLFIGSTSSCVFHRSYTLEGYIYEAYSKTPLPGITVKTGELSSVSDQEGFFRIKDLPNKKVPITVGDQKNYTDLTDILLLDQKVNHRDFILSAKHPLGIDLSAYNEPSSYSFTYHVTRDKDIPTAIYSGESVPIDETLKLLGKFFDKSGKWKTVEAIQIGLSFFEKDEYNNWNEPAKPNMQALQFQSDAGDLVKKAYHFFEDPLFTFKEEPGIVIIEGVKTILFHIQSSAKENTARQYDVYLISEGPTKGQAKKIVRTILGESNPGGKTQVTLILNQWNTDFQIQPPQITQ